MKGCQAPRWLPGLMCRHGDENRGRKSGDQCETDSVTVLVYQTHLPVEVYTTSRPIGSCFSTWGSPLVCIGTSMRTHKLTRAPTHIPVASFARLPRSKVECYDDVMTQQRRRRKKGCKLASKK